MASSAAALLDQLMGRNRNAGSGEKTAREHWSDPEVCKYFLCGFCPSQLFTNTRSDVGVCDKIHDETFQIAYEASPDKGKKGYEERFLDYLEKLVRDLDRRIQRGKERLDRSAEANKKAFDDEGGSMFSEKLQELTKQIAHLINQSEELGASGRVDDAQELISRVEELEREKEKERSAMMLKANVPQTVAGFEIDPGNFHEKNEICDVCGCFLIIGDTQARMDAHLMGKQHMGFARIRSTIVELKQAREERLKKEMEERIARRESHNERSSPTDPRSHDQGRRRSHRSRSKDRHRSSSRDKRKRRSRSREKKRSRSQSREKKERSRSGERKSPLGERKRKSRSRSRERKRRSRSRDKKRRSRSGERKRKSRSRSRERKRSRSRSRDKKRRRSRSRSHDRRTSYSKDRNRRRSYRSRSFDRSRHHRHRSNSRSRSRSRERGEKKNDSSKEERSEGVKNHDENQTSKDDIMETNEVQAD